MNRALILALLVAPGLAPVATAQDFMKNPTGVVVDTTLDALRTTPAAFKSIWVRFPIQFCSVGKVANPFFTQFVPSEYANFYAWSADQPIWQKESYDDVFPCLFVNKSNPEVDKLYEHRLYDRMMVTGVVKNTFQDQPWIEVMAFEPIEQKVDTATLSHLYRAESYMARRQWNLAASELSLAPGCRSAGLRPRRGAQEPRRVLPAHG